MTLRSLLVHVDASERCHARLLAARILARRHEARITALFADAPLELDEPFGYAAGSTAAHHLQEREVSRRAAARRRFDTLIGRHGQAGWAELDGEAPAAGVARHALCNDLVVLGQHESPGTEAPGLPDDFVESVIIASGRPALVLPRIAVPLALPQTIVVAWKASPASAHAMAGALPLLREARQVHVVGWAESAGQVDGGEVLAYLELHGVSAQWQGHARAPRDICDALLKHCEALQADLLVMGCYSHGRLRERLLGGVTREMLRTMTLPVLMAH
jgi:nucleotide-binding universal stress UspA family protein